MGRGRGRSTPSPTSAPPRSPSARSEEPRVGIPAGRSAGFMPTPPSRSSSGRPALRRSKRRAGEGGGPCRARRRGGFAPAPSAARAPPRAGRRRARRAPRSGPRGRAGPVAQPVDKDLAHLAAQVQRDPGDAGRAGLGASSRISSTCAGESLMPGISGAIRTPVGIPARLSSATASIRLRGWGVRGSVARQARSSRVGIERLARELGAPASSRIRSRSRSSSGDFVSTEHGLRGVEHRLPDPAHQPVATLHPLVGVGVRPQRDVLAAPRRPAQLGPQQLGHVDLDHDLALEVLAGDRGPGTCASGGRSNMTQHGMHPRYGLTVQRKGTARRPGTRFSADLASTSWKRMPSASGASKVRTVGGPPSPGRRAPSAPSTLSPSQRTNACSHTRRRPDGEPSAQMSPVEARGRGRSAERELNASRSGECERAAREKQSPTRLHAGGAARPAAVLTPPSHRERDLGPASPLAARSGHDAPAENPCSPR